MTCGWLLGKIDLLPATLTQYLQLAEGINIHLPYSENSQKVIHWMALRPFSGERSMKPRVCSQLEFGSIHDCGFLGGSPDGLIEDYGIVEVKCPFKHRESTSLLNDLKDQTYILFFDDNKDLQLNTNNDYYHQIQGNLWLTNRKNCYLVIWTPFDNLICNIGIDKDWQTNVNILKTFYMNVYIPFLIGNKNI
nr:unnamed protein product [Callosobruchus chinensis]